MLLKVFGLDPEVSAVESLTFAGPNSWMAFLAGKGRGSDGDANGRKACRKTELFILYEPLIPFLAVDLTPPAGEATTSYVLVEELNLRTRGRAAARIYTKP